VEGAGDDPDHNLKAPLRTYMSSANLNKLSSYELSTIRAAAAIAAEISKNPEGGSILMCGLDDENLAAVVESPKTGIAVSFDKTTECMLPSGNGTYFLYSIADWMFRTRSLVRRTALAAAINKGADSDCRYEVADYEAGAYLDSGLCVGWWKNSNGIVVLDWSCVFPHAAIAHAAACAIGAAQEAVYVVDTGTVVKVESGSVKGVGFDIVVYGGVKTWITAKI